MGVILRLKIYFVAMTQDIQSTIAVLMRLSVKGRHIVSVARHVAGRQGHRGTDVLVATVGVSRSPKGEPVTHIGQTEVAVVGRGKVVREGNANCVEQGLFGRICNSIQDRAVAHQPARRRLRRVAAPHGHRTSRRSGSSGIGRHSYSARYIRSSDASTGNDIFNCVAEQAIAYSSSNLAIYFRRSIIVVQGSVDVGLSYLVSNVGRSSKLSRCRSVDVGIKVRSGHSAYVRGTEDHVTRVRVDASHNSATTFGSDVSDKSQDAIRKGALCKVRAELNLRDVSAVVLGHSHTEIKPVNGWIVESDQTIANLNRCNRVAEVVHSRASGQVGGRASTASGFYFFDPLHQLLIVGEHNRCRGSPQWGRLSIELRRRRPLDADSLSRARRNCKFNVSSGLVKGVVSPEGLSYAFYLY